MTAAVSEPTELNYCLTSQELSFRGNNAAATRLPSSASRLYVEQAFHYNCNQYTPIPCLESETNTNRVHDIYLDPRLVKVISKCRGQPCNGFPSTEKENF